MYLRAILHLRPLRVSSAADSASYVAVEVQRITNVDGAQIACEIGNVLPKEVVQRSHVCLFSEEYVVGHVLDDFGYNQETAS